MDPNYPWMPAESYQYYVTPDGAESLPTIPHAPDAPIQSSTSSSSETYLMPEQYPTSGHSYYPYPSPTNIFHNSPMSDIRHAYPPHPMTYFTPTDPTLGISEYHASMGLSSGTASISYGVEQQHCYIPPSAPNHPPPWDFRPLAPSSPGIAQTQSSSTPASIPLMNDLASQNYLGRPKRHSCPRCGEKFPTVTLLNKHTVSGCFDASRFSMTSTLVNEKTLTMARIKRPGVSLARRSKKAKSSTPDTLGSGERNTSASLSPASPSTTLIPSPSMTNMGYSPTMSVDADSDLHFVKAAAGLSKRPSRNKWIPQSLIFFSNSANLTSQAPFYDVERLAFKVPAVPLPPVFGRMVLSGQTQGENEEVSITEEERNSYRSEATDPYHPFSWNGYLPGPAPPRQPQQQQQQLHAVAASS